MSYAKFKIVKFALVNLFVNNAWQITHYQIKTLAIVIILFAILHIVYNALIQQLAHYVKQIIYLNRGLVLIYVLDILI